MSWHPKATRAALLAALLALQGCVDDVIVGLVTNTTRPPAPAVDAAPQVDDSGAVGTDGGVTDGGPEAACSAEECSPVRIAVNIDDPLCPNGEEPVCERNLEGICELGCAGEIVVRRQACQTESGTAPCAENAFCHREIGSCASPSGMCMERPASCGAPGLAPVCGCDGVTYGSECEAFAQGVSLQAFDACP